MTEIIKSPLKAIKAKCVDCCGGEKSEVKECHIETCTLWPFRFGKNPFSQRGSNMSDEQRQAAGERMKNARMKRIETK